MPRQAVGDGVAGHLAQAGGAVGSCAGEDRAYASFVQQGGVVQTGAQGVEAARQVAMHTHHHGSGGSGQSVAHLPGLGATQDH